MHNTVNLYVWNPVTGGRETLTVTSGANGSIKVIKGDSEIALRLEDWEKAIICAKAIGVSSS